MLQFITSVARFAYLVMMVLFIIFGWVCYRKLPSQRKAAYFADSQIIIIVLFQIVSDTIIVLNMVHNGDDLMPCLWLLASGAGMIIMGILAGTLHDGTGRLIWNAIFMLLSISITILWRLNMQIAIQQIRWMLVCFVLINIVLLVMRGNWIYKIPYWIFILATVGLILLPFAFPKTSGGALNWANVKGFVFQPSEFAKLTFIFFISYVYSRRRSMFGLLLTTGVTAFTALALLLQNDLGGVMIFGIIFWFMTYEYLDRWLWLVLGALGVAAAGFLAYKLVGHVRVRVDAWIDPWADYDHGGYQIAQSLFAIAGGGWFGTGLYLGVPTTIPVHTTDMIFACLAEEFGVIFCMLLILLYTFLFLTMMEYARHETEPHKRSLLLGFAVLFMTQTFVIIGGTIKLIPLTGVTLPLMSYGGSSMLSMFLLFGIVQGIIRSSYPPRRGEVYENEPVPQAYGPGYGNPPAGYPGQGYPQDPGYPGPEYGNPPYGNAPAGYDRRNDQTDPKIRTPYKF